jgi:hypothetical protein
MRSYRLLIFIRLVIGLSLLACALPASALTVASAKIANGSVEVKGSKAVPLAAITWQGAPVAMHVDLSIFVTHEPIFGAVACRGLGLLTPTA